MKAFIVTVRPGAGDSRYADSVWIERDHADQRAAELVGEFVRIGKGGKVQDNLTEGWGAWVSEITIRDASLAKKEKA